MNLISSASETAPSPELDAKIVAALERLSQALHKTLWDTAWQKGLSATQAQVLLYLQTPSSDGATIGDLARRFDLKHATLSDVVRVLVGKGLLERKTDPNDARAVRVCLSARGRGMARSLARWTKQVQQQVSELSPTAKVQLLSILLEFLGRLQRGGMIQVARMCTTCLFFEANRYADPLAPHHCRLMDQPLHLTELRVECPDHQPKDQAAGSIDVE